MNIEALAQARARLHRAETRVVTADGRELLEQRSDDGTFRSTQISVRPWGFVGDLKPDLQVARVAPRLLVGSQDVAQDLALLQSHSVSHILNVAQAVECQFPQHFTYLAVPLLDLPSADLLTQLPACLAFISAAAEEGGVVFVHCNAGVSRSVSVVIAWLVRDRGWSVDTALAHVRQTRPAARPNEGFLRQLNAFAANL